MLKFNHQNLLLTAYNFFYVPSFITTIKHRCVALLYVRFFIERCETYF